MEKEKNIQIVQQIYADFGKGNIEGILNSLTDDIIWSDPGYPEVPYAKKRTGKNEVVSFFNELAAAVSYSKFAPEEFYADKDAVIVKGSFAGKANSTGKAFESEWVMIWKLRNGKIYSYLAFVDTAKMSSALK